MQAMSAILEAKDIGACKISIFATSALWPEQSLPAHIVQSHDCPIETPGALLRILLPEIVQVVTDDIDPPRPMGPARKRRQGEHGTGDPACSAPGYRR